MEIVSDCDKGRMCFPGRCDLDLTPCLCGLATLSRWFYFSEPQYSSSVKWGKTPHHLRVIGELGAVVYRAFRPVFGVLILGQMAGANLSLLLPSVVPPSLLSFFWFILI